MRESKIEAHLVDEVQKRGGIAYKFVSPGLVGVPDRLVILPDGRWLEENIVCSGACLFFVELKATGEEPDDKQLRRHRELRDLGQTVHVADSIERVDAILKLYEVAA